MFDLPIEAIMFYGFAALALAGSAGVLLSGDIVRMAIWLLATLFSAAGLFFLLGASFVAAVQLIVYAGGTLIMIVFGVMLTSRAYGVRLRPRAIEALAGLVVCAGLFAGLVAILSHTAWTPANPNPPPAGVATLGKELLTTYLVPFELASVLLLAVMIGAAYLAQPVKRNAE